MTLEEFQDVYRDKTPVEKLALMTVQFDYWRNDTKDRADANWRGNFYEAAYYAGECEAMKARIEWLYGEISNALQAQEPRVMSYDELEDTMNTRAVWYEAFLTEIPSLAIVAEKSAMVDAYIIFDHMSGTRHQCTHKTYGDVWRCWTSRPTDAQREATPWPK